MREGKEHRKIRLIEGNVKCRQLKILTCKETLRQVLICLRPRTPYTMYTCIQYKSYSHREGGRGGAVEPERKIRGAKVHKAGLKITT